MMVRYATIVAVLSGIVVVGAAAGGSAAAVPTDDDRTSTSVGQVAEPVRPAVFAVDDGIAPISTDGNGAARGGRPPEVLDDPPAPRSVLKRLVRMPASDWPVGRFTSVQVNVDEFDNNVVGDAANEPSIAIDLTNPDRMVIGWRQFDTIESNFRQAGIGYSHDGGQTWTFPGVLDPGQFRSDPVLAADPFGNFFYSSLSSGTSAELFKSTDGGVTWSAPVPAFGGDKQWITVDQTSGIGAGNIYQNWNIQFTCCPPNDFTRSIDGGASFESPIALPLPSLKWGTLAVGPDGELYVAGSTLDQTGHLVVRSSTAQDPSQTPTFDFITSVDLGGFTIGSAGPNPGGIVGQVYVAVDHSEGPMHGNVYVLGSVVPGGADPIDVHLIRSTDGGVTWSSPVLVNDSPVGAWDWFATMSVAPNGRIDVVWNDTRNDSTPATPNESELRYSFSLDGGDTWYASEIVSPQFDSHAGWPQQNKLGDYYHMISDNGAAKLAYSATFNGEQDVYFVRITPDCNGNGIADETDIADTTSDDCNSNLVPDECEPDEDCNSNGVQDICDVAGPTSEDCNHNYVPDECEPDEDCNENSIQDICDIADGTSQDCNRNGTPDECELAGNDCNNNSVPDECDLSGGDSQDCNGNSIPDECDIGVISSDCQPDGVPDECQTDAAIILTEYSPCSPAADNGEAWCDNFETYPVGSVGSIDGLNGWGGWAGNPNAVAPVAMDQNHTPGGSKSLFIATHDTVRTFTGYNQTASRAWILSTWIYIPGTMQGQAFYIVLSDYDGGGGGTVWAMQLSMNATTGFFNDDLTGQRVPLVTDQWVEIRITVDLQEDAAAIYYNGELVSTKPWVGAGGTPNIAAIDLFSPGSTGFYFDDLSMVPARVLTADCNNNTIPDECDIADTTAEDCNDNLVPDTCEPDTDCNSNEVQDICDVVVPGADCNSNAIPDDCEADDDCNNNTLQDICDIVDGTSTDCDWNQVPDECELAANDCNSNGALDVCDALEGTSPDCNGNLIPDECDIGVISNDCQPDDVPDECQLDGLVLIVEEELCSPVATAGEPWCDDFEDYTVGSIHGVGGWEGWTGDPGLAGTVSTDQNHTVAGANSLYVANGESTLRQLNGYDQGAARAWVFRAQIYVPAAADDLTAILIWSDYDGGDVGTIPGVIVVADPVSGLFFNWLTGTTLPAIVDQWVEVRVEIDFGRDLAVIYYDDVLLDMQPWTVNGGSLAIAGFDVRAFGSVGFYSDDLSVYPAARTFTTDCNHNLTPDECDLAGGSSLDDNGNGIPDECEFAVPDPPLADPSGYDKNRYLSFMPTNPGESTALRVRLVDLDGFAGFNGEVRWVGPPTEYPEEDSSDPLRTFTGARLQCEALFMDWSTIDDILHVFDAEVVPNSIYDVQVIYEESSGWLDDEERYSEPLTVLAATWGDMVEPFAGGPSTQPDFLDITACVSKFKAEPDAPIKARTQVQPNVPNPTLPVDFSDISAIVDAFRGDPYPFDGPSACE